jgi:hypothetical protein
VCRVGKKDSEGEKQMAMAERRNVEFAVEGGATLRG